MVLQTRYFRWKTKTLVQDVSQMHEEVSEQGREAEQICMKILLLQHPVAKRFKAYYGSYKYNS